MSGTDHQSAPARAEDLRVLMAPTNVAMNPMLLTEEFQRRGLDVHHLKFAASASAQESFGFRTDRVVDMSQYEGQRHAMLAALEQALDDGVNLFHFWTKTLLFETRFGGVSGLDLPIIKSHDRRIVHRFTGFDARVPSEDRELNPFSPFHYGYEYPYDEADVLRHRTLVRDYADALIVQDPEIGQFVPEATVVPRVLNLPEWPYSGPTTNRRPLVVHAPTNTVVKGTPFIVEAVEQLQRAGLAFDFKLIEGMAQSAARDWYRRADVIVDQILIGATGVLTLEGWALGKTVVANVRPELFEPFYGVEALPIVHATPDTIREGIERAVRSSELREQLALESRALVEAHHDVTAVADRLLALYLATLEAPTRTASTRADIASLRALLEQQTRRATPRRRDPASSGSGADLGSASVLVKLKRLFWESSPSEYAFKIRRYLAHRQRNH